MANIYAATNGADVDDNNDKAELQAEQWIFHVAITGP